MEGRREREKWCVCVCEREGVGGEGESCILTQLFLLVFFQITCRVTRST